MIRAFWTCRLVVCSTTGKSALLCTGVMGCQLAFEFLYLSSSHLQMGASVSSCMETSRRGESMMSQKLTVPESRTHPEKHSSSVYLSEAEKKSFINSNDYQPKRFLGRGEHGITIAVRRRNAPEEGMFAMKIMDKSLIKDKNIIHSNRLEDVSQARSPFLVSTHNVFENPSKIYLIIDYLKFGDLCFYLYSQKWLGQRTLREISAEVLLGIKVLHNLKVIYRNLKPENVLVMESGHVQLTDYWLGRWESGGGSIHAFDGNLDYSPPEVITNAGYNAKLDIWAFGVFLYQLGHGKPPFHISDQQQVVKEAIVEGLYTVNETFSDDYKDLLRTLLVTDPEKRPCTEQIQEHPFFSGVDWDLVQSRRNQAPLKAMIQEYDIRLRQGVQMPNRVGVVSALTLEPILHQFNYRSEDVSSH